MRRLERVILIVLDSLGIGAAEDAEAYGDGGAFTLRGISSLGAPAIPELRKLGLGNIREIPGISSVDMPDGAYGMMKPCSAGKDTIIGHWEMMGLIMESPFPVYPGGFPEALIDDFQKLINSKTLGNKAASGTEIINELGSEHVRTSFPIVYTSADSVFQIAAHESVIPLERLYDYCEAARKLLQGEHGVARVIARPFIGKSGNYDRTANRRDYALPPPADTIIDRLAHSFMPVISVGKISDIFAGRGFSRAFYSSDNGEGMAKTLKAMHTTTRGLIFTNLVDFDTKFGHRRDIPGYRRALEEFDRDLKLLRNAMKPGDLCIITADHGCDPAWKGTDHTRENVPLLAFGSLVRKGKDLGIRNTFADVGATVWEALASGATAENIGAGTSFLGEAVY